MELSLFKALEVTLRSYSRQSARALLDHHLRIRIILKVPPASFLVLAAAVQLPPAQTAVFGSKARERRLKQMVCIVIDHPIGLSLDSFMLANIQECITIGQSYDNKGKEQGTSNNSNLVQNNNILEQNNRFSDHLRDKEGPATKALLIKVAQTQLEAVTQQLEAYLSVCEVFHGHLHLIVSCFEAETTTCLVDEMQPVQGDQFADYRENSYFRILQERASRVTLEQLGQNCRIDKQPWGEVLVFGDGTDSLIVWVTKNRLPLLGVTPSVRKTGKVGKKTGKTAYLATLTESRLGLKIFTRRQVAKSKLEDLEATTIIFNIREEYDQETQFGIGEAFEREAREVVRRTCLVREQCGLEGSLQLCERVGQLLELPAVVLLKVMMRS